jgi:hypothetical protein
MKEKQKQHNS